MFKLSVCNTLLLSNISDIFSRLRKYSVFVSPSSYHLVLFLNIIPFIFWLLRVSNSNFLSSNVLASSLVNE